jgi:hypothetical protein
MARKRIDMLPSGPKWSVQRVVLEKPYETADPIILYKRNTAECVGYLLNNPLFADKVNFVPVKYYTSDGKRVFREALSGVQAWETQVLIYRILKYAY